MKRLNLAAALLAAMALAGCGLMGGTTVVKYDKGSPMRMTEAPRTATYSLYSTTDRTPQVSYRLEEGEKIGFREEGDQVIAVAGMHEQPIKTGMGKNTYYWKMEKK